MKKIDNSIKITGMIIAAVLILTLIVVATTTSITGRKTINAQGEAVVSVMPDIISINFVVETKANTSKEAKDENSKIVDEVIAALIAIDFEREDIETMDFNIYEEYDWSDDTRKSIGFKATHTLRVKFDTGSRPELGSIIDAGVDAGALLQYISFELSPELESKYKAQALELAGADAKLKATAMVSGVGGQLGKLVSISETNFGYQPWIAYDTMSLKAESDAGSENVEESTSIQVGKREITGRISVTYEIK